MSTAQLPREPATHRTLRAIHAAALLCLVLVWGLAGSLVWQSHHKTTTDARQDIARLTTAAASEINRTLVSMDALLAELSGWSNAPQTDLARLLQATLNSQMLLRNVALLDADHRVLASARLDALRLGVGADPAFLDSVLAQPFPALAVSAPTQTDLAPEQLIYLARSAPRPNGRKLLVVAEARVSILADQLDTGDGGRSASTLELANGQLLAAYPPHPHTRPTLLQPPLPDVQPTIPPADPGGSAVEAVQASARMDAAPSWMGVQPLLYPGLWVSVSQPQDQLLQGWRQEALAVAGIAAILSVLLSGLWWGGVGHVHRMAAANARIRDANERLASGNQALQRTVALVEATLDATADAVVVVNHQHRVVRFNARYLAVMGMTASELQNQSAEWLRARLARLLTNADEASRVAAATYELTDRESQDELRFMDGRVYLRHSIAQRLDGQTVGRVWSYQDITGFRAAERRLQERETALELTRSELSATLEAIPDLLFELDEHGLYLNVHAHNPRKLVVHPSVFLGKRVKDVLPPHTAAITMACLHEAAATGTSYGKQIRLDLPQGPMWFELSAARKPGPEGSVKHIVVLSRDITDRKRSEELIWEQAHLDQLTGLPNRRLFRERLDQALQAANQHQPPHPVGLMFVDLDRFKVINDTHGHDVGDQLLQSAGQRLQGCMGPDDLVARLGGDEFTLVVCGPDAAERMRTIAEEAVARLSEVFVLGAESEFISASVGMTLFPDDALDSDTLVRQADQAMYAAKQAGRNRCERFSPQLQEAALARARIARDLRTARTDGQLSVVYQPIVDLRTGLTHKAEALLRWHHPEQGPIGPAVFIPVAEEYGLIQDLGEWVFEQAVIQVRQWRQTLHPEFQISVNKSPVQFRAPTATSRHWGEYLAAAGLPGNSITVEITEGLLMEASDTARAHLNQLSSSGLHIALDDFGTGYSALSYLHQYDLNVLKIDRAFVRNLATSPKDLTLCKAIIAMARELGMQVVAEGIETGQQRQLLADAGCDFGQGYWFSRPLPPQELELWMAQPSTERHLNQ